MNDNVNARYVNNIFNSDLEIMFANFVYKMYCTFAPNGKH